MLLTACAPYGYYGPDGSAGGIFIGAGPWFRGGYYGRGYYGRGYGYYGRGGYYGGRGYYGADATTVDGYYGGGRVGIYWPQHFR